MDATRVSYLTGFTQLSLWFLGQSAKKGDESFADILNRRVNIYRNTSLYDGERHPAREPVGEEWEEVVHQLESLYTSNADAFEDEGLRLLWPLMEVPLRRSSRRDAPHGPYECWTSDYRNEGRVGIHIHNVYKPRSPLADMQIPFAASLIRLLEDSQLARPDVEVVSCGSWMNSTPRFAELFPEFWPTSAVSRNEINYTMGHWGQFEDRKGDYHSRNGDRFRKTGELPFAATNCHAHVDEVLDHLRRRFPEAIEYNQSLPTGD